MLVAGKTVACLFYVSCFLFTDFVFAFAVTNEKSPVSVLLAGVINFTILSICNVFFSHEHRKTHLDETTLKYRHTFAVIHCIGVAFARSPDSECDAVVLGAL